VDAAVGDSAAGAMLGANRMNVLNATQRNTRTRDLRTIVFSATVANLR
jgi:hypothetical protein